MQIQPGDIIFYKPVGFIGWFISRLTKSEYSHVALAIDSYNIIEANRFIKSRISNLGYVEEIHKVYRITNISERQQYEVVSTALTMLDVSYDYSQIVGLFIRLTLHRDGFSLNTANKYICSEIIDRALYQSGIPRTDTDHLGDITPQELFDKYKLVQVK